MMLVQRVVLFYHLQVSLMDHLTEDGWLLILHAFISSDTDNLKNIGLLS
jgi:hypothetical protein